MKRKFPVLSKKCYGDIQVNIFVSIEIPPNFQLCIYHCNILLKFKGPEKPLSHIYSEKSCH